MKKSSGAALLSGLVFPGLGHLFLKQHLPGAGLLVASLAALAFIVRTAYQRALTVVERITSGDIPLEAGAIAEAVAGSSGSGGGLADTAAVVAFTTCWLIGIADSYRIGAAQENQSLTEASDDK